MTSTLRSVRTIAALLILTLPLTGCVDFVRNALAKILSPVQTRTVVVAQCPEGLDLEAPPEVVTDALATVVDDPAGGRWIDGLFKHYEDLEKCR